MSAKVLIEVEGDFAVRTGPKPMSSLFELLLDGLVGIEFTVYNNAKAFIFVGNGLVSGC